MYLPNAFSPNGDGTNDVFIVRSTILKSGKLVVFDRWEIKYLRLLIYQLVGMESIKASQHK